MVVSYLNNQINYVLPKDCKRLQVVLIMLCVKLYINIFLSIYRFVFYCISQLIQL
jgi:hypothetical protein